MQTKIDEIICRRDGQRPLKFSGKQIGSACRHTSWGDENSENEKDYDIFGNLFSTDAGKWVFQFQIYNATDERVISREGWAAESLEALADTLKKEMARTDGLDEDILAQVFEDTAIADWFIEEI